MAVVCQLECKALQHDRDIPEPHNAMDDKPRHHRPYRNKRTFGNNNGNNQKKENSKAIWLHQALTSRLDLDLDHREISHRFAN